MDYSRDNQNWDSLSYIRHKNAKHFKHNREYGSARWGTHADIEPFIVHFDAVYLCKRSIYLIMAIIGLANWIKLHRTRNRNNE